MLGLLFGLVLGGGFFVLKLDQYVKEISFIKSLTQDNDTPDETAQVKDSANSNSKTSTHPKQNNVTTNVATDTSNALAMNAVPDSLIYDSITAGPAGDEDIVVRKDELVNSQVLAVSSPEADSTQKTTSSSYTVEFWRSPLNYKGYKLSRNKLAIFGISANDQPALIRLGDDLYLRSATGVYRLSPSADFRGLERIFDEQLIARLK